MTGFEVVAVGSCLCESVSHESVSDQNPDLAELGCKVTHLYGATLPLTHWCTPISGRVCEACAKGIDAMWPGEVAKLEGGAL